MRTDTIFYQLFQLFPDLLTDLLGENQAGNYFFTSVEVKELSRRIDGVFLPNDQASEQRMYFAEVQFQKDDTFYERLMTETFLFLGQYRPQRLWRSVAIWARRGLDDSVPLHYRELQDLDLLQVVYLDELEEGDSLGVALVRLITAKDAEVRLRIKTIQQRSVSLQDASLRRQVIELMEKVVVYKFPQLTAEALEAMFGLKEWEQTRFYQDVLQRGVAQGIEQGKEIGEIEGKLTVARNLRSRGFSVAEIAQILEIPPEIIEQALNKTDS